jgi:hypothetical protein
MHRPITLLRPVAAVLVALILALSACGGDPEPGGDDGSSESGATGGGGESAGEAAAEEPYLPVPDGVELTAQGSTLEVGDKAVVAYEPRQDKVAALEITVTRLVDADFDDFVGWKLTPATRKTNPYFVPDKGDLTAVSFRPVEDFDPITWTGKLEKPGAGDKKSGKKGKKGKKGGKKNGGGRG